MIEYLILNPILGWNMVITVIAIALTVIVTVIVDETAKPTEFIVLCVMALIPVVNVIMILVSIHELWKEWRRNGNQF